MFFCLFLGAEMNQELQDLSGIARNYCALIESVDRVDSRWLDKLWRLLPRLHVAVMALETARSEQADLQVEMDMEGRFQMFSHLHRLLGERDAYWLKYDALQGMSEMSGSLADDITDIYYELKQALKQLDSDPGHPCRAAGMLSQGFADHWGQHLVDAERHLYELQVYRSSQCINRDSGQYI